MTETVRQLPRTVVPLLLAALASGPAQAATVSLLAGTVAEGDANVGYPLNTALFNGGAMRYQQIYSDSLFASLNGVYEINAIAFRTDGTQGNSFASTTLDLRIDLSTSSAAVNGLDMIFGNNVGNDRTTVFNGPLSLSSAHALTASGSRAFDVVINFTSPFRFTAGTGSLLLDIFNYSGGLTSQLDGISAGGDGMSRLFAYDLSPRAGRQDSTGLVTEFRLTTAPVPLPAAFQLLLTAVGTLLLIAQRRTAMAVVSRPRQ
jgi:hypothetical protein